MGRRVRSHAGSAGLDRDRRCLGWFRGQVHRSLARRDGEDRNLDLGYHGRTRTWLQGGHDDLQLQQFEVIADGDTRPSNFFEQ